MEGSDEIPPTVGHSCGDMSLPHACRRPPGTAVDRKNAIYIPLKLTAVCRWGEPSS